MDKIAIKNCRNDWLLWCRLCGKENSSNNINIYIKSEQTSETSAKPNINNFDLVDALEKYCRLEIRPYENLPETICTECFSLIKKLTIFNEQLLNVQQMYKVLLQTADINNYADLHAIRSKYLLASSDSGIYSVSSGNFDHNTPSASMEMEIEIEELKIELYETDVANPLQLLPREDSKEAKDAAFESDDSIIENISERFCTENVNDVQTCEQETIKCKKANDEHAMYTCNICSNIFPSLQGFRVHMKRVHGIQMPRPELYCTQCSNVFGTNYELKLHKQIHVPLVERRIVKCRLCEKRFTTAKSMELHVKHAHTNERSFICEQCGLAVRTNCALKRHMVMHTGVTAFPCEKCPKRFKHQFQLIRHMEIHNPKKHTCDECGLQLSTRLTLKYHMVVHSNEKPYKCENCGRAFKRAKTLKSHLLIHAGIKPYACDFCDLSFSSSAHCYSHKQSAHSVEFANRKTKSSNCQTKIQDIPKLSTLQAISKTTKNLHPVIKRKK